MGRLVLGSATMRVYRRVQCAFEIAQQCMEASWSAGQRICPKAFCPIGRCDISFAAEQTTDAQKADIDSAPRQHNHEKSTCLPLPLSISPPSYYSIQRQARGECPAPFLSNINKCVLCQLSNRPENNIRCEHLQWSCYDLVNPCTLW
jgi:hypothetical protein